MKVMKLKKIGIVNNNEISNNTNNVVSNNNKNINESIETSNNSKSDNSNNNKSGNIKSSDDYFTNSRLTRDTMYSQMIENYQKILENESISTEQKAISQTEVKKINDLKNSIMICENLIKTKGVEDVVILVNDESINVIIKSNEMIAEQVAQVQNIVSREMKAKIENIHISNR